MPDHDCAACTAPRCCTVGWCLDTADCIAHCTCLNCASVRRSGNLWPAEAATARAVPVKRGKRK